MHQRRIGMLSAVGLAAAMAVGRPLAASVEPLQEVGLVSRAPKPTTHAQQRQADPTRRVTRMLSRLYGHRRQKTPCDLEAIAQAEAKRLRRNVRNSYAASRGGMIAA